MKRFRLSTLLLLVVIAALCFALVMQDRLAARRLEMERLQTARLVAELEMSRGEIEQVNLNMEITLQQERARSKMLADQLEAAKERVR